MILSKTLLFFLRILFFSLLSTGCFLKANISDLNSQNETPQNTVISPKVLIDPINANIESSLSAETFLTWQSADPEITTFKISLSTSGVPNENCLEAELIYDASSLEFNIANLNSDTIYHFRICSNLNGITSPGITGSFKTLKLATRSPAFSSFSNWNDYLENDGPNFYDATQVNCQPPNSSLNHNHCINGGLSQKVVIPEVINCNRIKASDQIKVFRWYCKNTASETVIYSTELNKEKGLQDLISFADYQFKNNYITISVDGTPTYSTVREKWWTNIIEELPDAAINTSVSLSNAGEASGKIFIVSSPKSGGAYNITEDKISVVVMKGVTLKRDASTNLIFFNRSATRMYLWFEGKFDGNNVSQPIFQVTSSISLRFHNIEILNYASEGINLSFSAYCIVSDFKIHKGAGNAIVGNSGSANLIRDGHIFNSSGDGLYQIHSSIITNILFSGNASTNQAISYGHNSRFSYISLVNNNWNYSIRGFSGSGGLYHNLLNINSNGRIVYAWNTSGITFSQLMSFNTTWTPIYIDSTSTRDHKFTNNLVLNGSGCQITDNTSFSPGLVNGTCQNDGLYSDANFISVSPDLTKIFVGKVTSDDLINQFDNWGLASFASILNWLGFENPYRAWGLNGDSFPSTNNRGICSSGDCRIWDYRLKSDSDNIAFNSTNLVTTKNESFIPGSNCPSAVNGNKVTNYTNASLLNFTFLTNAQEILGDGKGNDNALCESGEECLYTPHFGAYQGEGDFYSHDSCLFQNGTISNVKMYAYPVLGI